MSIASIDETLVSDVDVGWTQRLKFTASNSPFQIDTHKTRALKQTVDFKLSTHQHSQNQPTTLSPLVALTKLVLVLSSRLDSEYESESLPGQGEARVLVTCRADNYLVAGYLLGLRAG